MNSILMMATMALLYLVVARKSDGSMEDSIMSIQGQVEAFRISIVLLFEADNEHLSEALDHVMSFFNDDEQELCVFSECFKKERRTNFVRERIQQASEEFPESVDIDSDFYEVDIKQFGDTYFVKIRWVSYNIFHENECSGFINGEYFIFFDKDAKITKWIITEQDSTDIQHCLS